MTSLAERLDFELESPVGDLPSTSWLDLLHRPDVAVAEIHDASHGAEATFAKDTIVVEFDIAVAL